MLQSDAASRAGVAIVEGIGSWVASAELTWLLIMASRRNLVSSENAMAQGRWQREPGSAVHNQDIGFLGYGKFLNVLLHVQPFWMQDQAWGSSLARE